MNKPNISKDNLIRFIETCHTDNWPAAQIVAQIHLFCLNERDPILADNTIVLAIGERD